MNKISKIYKSQVSWDSKLGQQSVVLAVAGSCTHTQDSLSKSGGFWSCAPPVLAAVPPFRYPSAAKREILIWERLPLKQPKADTAGDVHSCR